MERWHRTLDEATAAIEAGRIPATSEQIAEARDLVDRGLHITNELRLLPGEASMSEAFDLSTWQRGNTQVRVVIGLLKNGASYQERTVYLDLPWNATIQDVEGAARDYFASRADRYGSDVFVDYRFSGPTVLMAPP